MKEKKKGTENWEKKNKKQTENNEENGNKYIAVIISNINRPNAPIQRHRVSE